MRLPRIGLRRLVAFLAVGAALAGCRLPAPEPPPPAPAPTTPVLTGWSFDTCIAPSTTTMTAWLASPFRGVGIYIGGRSRGCPSQPNLTAAWVNAVETQGWKLLPLWVGYQAPCTGYSNTIDPANAAAQGTQEADDAVAAANKLGIGPASPIYFDLEAYPRDAVCIATVRTFISAWVAQLHVRGYVAGLYSSGASGIADQVGVVTDHLAFNSPDDLWFAHWNGVGAIFGSPYVPDALWANHQRHHQYLGGTNPDGSPRVETWGGVAINIDSTVSDGAVAGPP